MSCFRRCEYHNEKLSVYCETCTKCICHMCALWGGTVSRDVASNSRCIVLDFITELNKCYNFNWSLGNAVNQILSVGNSLVFSFLIRYSFYGYVKLFVILC